MKTALLFIAVVSLAVSASMPPMLPSSFYGYVSGYNAGQRLTASIDGVQVASTTLFTYQGSVVYSIDVPGYYENDPTGKTIVFKIGGQQVASGIWHSGTLVRLDISKPAFKVRSKAHK